MRSCKGEISIDIQNVNMLVYLSLLVCLYKDCSIISIHMYIYVSPLSAENEYNHQFHLESKSFR